MCRIMCYANCLGSDCGRSSFRSYIAADMSAKGYRRMGALVILGFVGGYLFRWWISSAADDDEPESKNAKSVGNAAEDQEECKMVRVTWVYMTRFLVCVWT